MAGTEGGLNSGHVGPLEDTNQKRHNRNHVQKKITQTSFSSALKRFEGHIEKSTKQLYKHLLTV